jgi:hypothetical protein
MKALKSITTHEYFLAVKKVVTNEYFPAGAVLFCVVLFWALGLVGGLSLLSTNQTLLTTLTWMLFVYAAAVLKPKARRWADRRPGFRLSALQPRLSVLLEPGRVAHSSPDYFGHAAGEVNNRRRLRPGVTGIDDGIHDVLEALLDFPPLGERVLLVGQQQGAGQQRFPELGEQGLHHAVVRDAHAHGLLLRVQQPAWDFFRGGQDEGVAARGDGLDAAEDVVVDLHQLAQLCEVLADQREVVLAVELPDGADPVQGLPVSQLRAQGVAGVGGVGDQAAGAENTDRLADQARLRVFGMNVQVSRHPTSLRPTAHRPSQQASTPWLRLVSSSSVGAASK